MAKKRTLESKLAEAELNLGKIAAEHSKAKQQLLAVLKELKQAQNVSRDFSALKPSIELISDHAKTALANSKADRETLARLVTSTSQFLTKKFDPLVAKVTDPDTGLAARVKQGTQFDKELNSLKQTAEKQVQQVKVLVRRAEVSNDELYEIAKACRAVKKAVEDDAKAVGDKRKIIEQELRKVQAASAAILKAEKGVKDKEREIASLFAECEKKHTAMEAWHEQAGQTLDKIQKIYEIAANTGLGGEFDKRRSILESEGRGWRRHVFVTMLTLLLLIIGLFLLELGSPTVSWDISKLTFDSHFYVRFLITSPVIFYLVFATRQYDKTRAMLERYAFKTTIALSIEAHMNLLLNQPAFKEMLPNISNFIVDGFNTIYREPYPTPKFKESKETTKDATSLLKAISELIHESKE
jgi:hypothetical protein